MLKGVAIIQKSCGATMTVVWQKDLQEPASHTLLIQPDHYVTIQRFINHAPDYQMYCVQRGSII